MAVQVVEPAEGGSAALGEGQVAGSAQSRVAAGMARVPSSPTTSRSARTTVTAPPTTQPIALSDEWTTSVVPRSIPSASRSRRRLLSVLGGP